MNLKQRLRKKLKKNGGFTLIEMLIVVAIIAILVIVSIPMVQGSLDKAKKATDDANVRAAKAAAMIEYLVNDKKGPFYYNEDGSVSTVAPTTGSSTGYTYGQGSVAGSDGGYVTVTITDGKATATWATVGG